MQHLIFQIRTLLLQKQQRMLKFKNWTVYKINSKIKLILIKCIKGNQSMKESWMAMLIEVILESEFYLGLMLKTIIMQIR